MLQAHLPALQETGTYYNNVPSPTTPNTPFPSRGGYGGPFRGDMVAMVVMVVGDLGNNNVFVFGVILESMNEGIVGLLENI